MIDPVADQPLQAEAPAARTKREPLWSVRFVLISVAQFLAYSNNVMLAPVLPLYLTHIGLTRSFVGVSMAFFSVTSFTTRPFVGVTVDRWSSRRVNILGDLALAAAGFGYLVASVPVFLFSRIVHGLGWAAMNTAGSTIVSQVTPERRRGEAFGYFHMARNLSHTLMPAFAVGLWYTAGPLPVFVVSGMLGLAAAVAVALIREVPPERAAESDEGFWLSLIEARALLPSALHILVNGGHPIATSYVALVAQDRGIEGLPFFFVALGVVAVVSQFLSPLSDRWGRAPVIAVSFVLGAVGLAVMMGADALLLLTLGGVVFSTGHAVAATTLTALTVDRAPPGRRGAALATFTAAFQVGAGMSGLVWGIVIDHWPGAEGPFYDGMFVGAILMLLAGLAVLALNWQAAGGRPMRPAVAH